MHMSTSKNPEAINGNTADLLTTNIETIASLHANSEKSISRHQRMIEAITHNLGRPVSLYIMLFIVAAWILVNTDGHNLHLKQFDKPPFSLLQAIVSVAGLIVSTMVLITQNRQAAVAHQRAHLDIQVNLLSEQKVTKLIALVEELRRDLPNVRNRHDPEAAAMAQSTDALAVSEALHKTLESNEYVRDALDD